jgi:integrase
MAHFPKPFYRAPRNRWCLQLGGKQINLGPDRAAAFERYHALMAEYRDGQPPRATKEAHTELAIVVIDRFLGWLRENKAARTLEWYDRHLAAFTAFLKEREGLRMGDGVAPRCAVAEIKPYFLTDTCAAHPEWSATTRHGFCRAVQRAFRWAEQEGLITQTPLRHVHKPTPRDKEIVVSQEEFERILAHVRDQDFRDLLTVAWYSGARPQELLRVEARHVDLELGRWVFPKDEAKGKKTPRVVYLTQEAKAITARLMAEHPEGPLFRNQDGNPWHRWAINCRFLRLKKKIGRKLHLGAFRKTWATEALKNGVDTVTAAHLLGHSNTAMLSRIYAKMQQDPEYMRKAMERAKGGAAHGD